MAQEILQVIRKALENHDTEFLVFTDLDRSAASLILANLEDPKYNLHESGFLLHYSARDGYLRLARPTVPHEYTGGWMVAQCGTWLAQNHISYANFRQIWSSRHTYRSFMGDYAGSKKMPDMAWTPFINKVRRDYPSVVLESGLAESDTQLMRDSRLWLEGTGGRVRVVMLCKTFAPNEEKKIKATLSISRIMPNGEIARDDLQLFPVPEHDTPDPYITVDELYGGNVPAGLGSNTQLPLDIQYLRELLGMGIQRLGCLTA
ncbi:hypothetical protein HOY80DRAFT_951164 [Tuber brumale]|nr:hypothetical protein HOY80DRAFT_951164 [Tuber brumale]